MSGLWNLVNLTSSIDLAFQSKYKPSLISLLNSLNSSIIYVDGAFNTNGSGVRIIIQGPDGVEITYALEFGFGTSNNEVEHKALITGPKMGRTIGAKKLLVVGQVLSTGECIFIKGKIIILYSKSH